jgi:hypothetical protein
MQYLIQKKKKKNRMINLILCPHSYWYITLSPLNIKIFLFPFKSGER